MISISIKSAETLEISGFTKICVSKIEFDIDECALRSP